MSLGTGDTVPSFTVLRAFNDPIAGEELWRERPALVLFYPLAFSGSMEGGCTKEMCQFRDASPQFDVAGVDIYGISHDSPFALAAWKEQLSIPFSLLSDWEWQAAKAFGVLEDELFGFRPLNTRASFLVGTDGKVQHAYDPGDPRVLPDPDNLLAAARQLAAR